MAEEQTNIPRIMELAHEIERDIARRRLKPGDRYLNAHEVSAMLRVSKQAANQAMQLLSQRHVLQRKQRLGTYVADPTDHDVPANIGQVRLLIPRSYRQREGLLSDGVLVGIHGHFPGADVQVVFMPHSDEEQFISQTVRQCLSTSQPVGLVLVRSSLTVQRAVEQSGLPAVIYGTAQPSVGRLPSLDRDQRQMGILLAECVLRRKHKRVLVLMRDRMLPGDHAFLDGVAEQCAKAGLSADALIHRDLPDDAEAIRCEVNRLLDRTHPRPGIIARNELLADSAVQAVTDHGWTAGKQITIAAADIYGQGSRNRPPYPYIRSTLTPQQQGEILGQLLTGAMEAPTAEPAHMLVSVELVDPE